MEDFKDKEKEGVRWLRKLGVIGLGVASVGGALLASPISLPGFIITLSNFMVVSGTVATIVSKSVLNDGGDDEDPPIAPEGLVIE